MDTLPVIASTANVQPEASLVPPNTASVLRRLKVFGIIDWRDKVTRIAKNSSLQTLAAACIAAIVLWGSSMLVLYLFVKPLASPDGGRTLVFDPVALVDAASIVVAVAILSWLPFFLLGPRRPTLLLAALTSVSTMVLLGGLFLVVDNVVGADRLGGGFFGRASLVLADGSDIVFLPIIDPLVSVCSGAAYSAALWLSIAFGNRNEPDGRFQTRG